MIYPGQGSPNPEIGVANRTATPVGPVVGQANQTAILNPPAPVTQVSNYQSTSMPVPETALALHNMNPYNNQDAVIGQSTHTPLQTPLGVSPHFKPPTENWTWVYGNGGGY